MRKMEPEPENPRCRTKRVGGTSLALGMGQDGECRQLISKASREEEKAERRALCSEMERRRVHSSTKGLEHWRQNPDGRSWIKTDQCLQVQDFLSCPLP